MRLIAATLAVMIPAQAMALSCVPPSVERSFAYAQKADDQFVVLSGRITFDERELPKAPKNPNDAPKLTQIPASISGHSLSKAGFQTMFEGDFTADLRCFGPWCGGLSSGETYLVFMKRTDQGYSLNVDPCYSSVFVRPTRQMLDAATACMNGAKCVSDF